MNSIPKADVLADSCRRSCLCRRCLPSGRTERSPEAEMLVGLTKEHFETSDTVRSGSKATRPAYRDDMEFRYDRSNGSRVATYYIAQDGKLREFILNGPNAEPYTPVKKRRAFIERMIEIVAPSSSRAERVWAANSLDAIWTRRMRPLPVQVGDYVFKGMTVGGGTGTHDTFWIIAASAGVTGLKYSPRS